jgi:transcriptional regulator with XRE-family HTH domain
MAGDIGFGNKLKLARLAKDLSIAELGRLAGVSKPHISEIENGKKHAGPDNLYALACALDVSLDYLIAPIETSVAKACRREVERVAKLEIEMRRRTKDALAGVAGNG